MYNEYMQIVNEYFDIHDTETRKTLLSLNEAEQNQVMANLAAKLYVSIVKKVADIDYGKIPDSKGDITQIPNFPDIMQTLDTIRGILVQNKQSTSSVDTLYKTVDNLKKYRNIWTKGFNTNCDMVIIFYSTVALSFVSATSLYIAATVEMVKSPTSGTFEIELARVSKSRSKECMLLKNLDRFNKACDKGDIEKAFTDVLKSNVAYLESVYDDGGRAAVYEFGSFETISAIATINKWCKILLGSKIFIVIALITCVIPCLHRLTVKLYHLRQKLSEYLDGEAEVIMLNAEKVSYDKAKTDAEKKKIIEKQLKIADRFKKWSDILMIKNTKAQKDAEKDVQQDNNSSIKISDLQSGSDISIF